MIHLGQRGFVVLLSMACAPGCGDDDASGQGAADASRRSGLCERVCDEASRSCADFDATGCRSACGMASTPGCADATEDLLACLANGTESPACDGGVLGLSADDCEPELRAVTDCIADQGDCDVQGPCLCDDGSQGERDCLTAECNCIPPGP